VDRAIASTAQPVAIAIGSNLGDRRAALQFAIGRLSSLLADISFSDIIETNPEGLDGEVLPDQPLYLNAVVSGSTTLGARALLDAILGIERDYGRERPFPGAPRTLDLDLVLLGDVILNEPGLHVPHPRFRERFFVLGPLAEIAPDMVDPVTGLRVGELLVRLLRDEQR
jgi:2-amino-4-hydroxy-6-hydroxymethyldihydropteridine diphosphokinase